MSSTLAKIRAAEQVLFDLACELRFVPVAPGTAHVHVGALELKRKVHAWQTAPPDEAAIDAILAELRKLAAEAQELRHHVRPGRQLACSVGSRRAGFPLARRAADESRGPQVSCE